MADHSRPWRRPIRALAIGLFVLAAAELVTAIAAALMGRSRSPTRWAASR